MLRVGLRRTATVHSKRLSAVLRGFNSSLSLHLHRRLMTLMHCGDLRRTRLHIDAAAAAVIAHAMHRMSAVTDVVVDNGPLVHGPNATTDSGHGAVVVEAVAAPVATEVADADIAEAVVDAAVVADMQSPVAGMEAIPSAVPAPIRRRPKRAVVRRFNPCARNPVVAIRSPRPVAGGPDVVRTWCGWLVVFGQWRRGLRRLFQSLLTR